MKFKKCALLFSLLCMWGLFTFPVMAEEVKSSKIPVFDNSVLAYEDSLFVLPRSKDRQINRTVTVECGSSKFGNYAIVININGVVTLDDSGNITGDNLSYSYNCRYPLQVYHVLKSYSGSYVSLSFAFFVTYPDGTTDLVTKDTKI